MSQAKGVMLSADEITGIALRAKKLNIFSAHNLSARNWCPLLFVVNRGVDAVPQKRDGVFYREL